MIRPMSLEDLDSVLILENQLFSCPWSYESYCFELKDNPFGHYVVLDEQGIKGYMGLWLNEDALQLTTIGVDPQVQNQGLATAMIHYMLEFASKNQVSVITLEVRVSNEKAIRLYEKVGFKKVAMRKQYYSHPDEDAILMMNQLEQK
jgi:ribosomal-protein-alanine N-acetyltransferase